MTIGGIEDTSSAATTVEVALDEFSIQPAESAAPVGSVAFSAANDGEEPHEIVVAAVTPDEITVVDGAPDEEALGDAFIGEIEAFEAGQTCVGAFELAAGDYTLFCAIVETEEDGTVESHYEEGMYTDFRVE